MATRIYTDSSGSVGVTPSTWNFAEQVNPVTVPGTLVLNTGTVMTSKTEATSGTSPNARALGRTIVGPLAAQTISGTVKGQMRAAESNSGANATLALAIKLVQPNGTDRAVLLAQTASDSATAGHELVVTTLTNMSFQDAAESASLTLSSQTATAGDYLVIEWGVRTATATARTVTLSYGNDSATPLPEDTSTTAANTPWWEFSQTLLFLVTTVTVTDATTLTDSLSVTLNHTVAPGAESISSSDSSVQNLLLAPTGVDGLTLGDLGTTQVSRFVTVTEGVTVGEAGTTAVPFLPLTGLDAVTVGEAGTTAVPFLAVPSADSIALGTTTVVSIVGITVVAGVRSLLDFWLGGSSGGVVVAAPAGTDAVTVGDSAGATLVHQPRLVDALTVGETTTVAIPFLALTAADSIGLGTTTVVVEGTITVIAGVRSLLDFWVGGSSGGVLVMAPAGTDAVTVGETANIVISIVLEAPTRGSLALAGVGV
jgi:hypothetical protein